MSTVPDPAPFTFTTKRPTKAERDARRRALVMKKIRAFPRFTAWIRKRPRSAFEIQLRRDVLKALAEVVAGKRPGPTTLRSKGFSHGSVR